jgi:hypothetical protein
MNEQEFIAHIVAIVRDYDGRRGLACAVFEAVCGADEDELEEHLEYRDSDVWEASGHCHNAWTEHNAPDFADANALGDWGKYSLASVQELCQAIMNAVIIRDGAPK